MATPIHFAYQPLWLQLLHPFPKPAQPPDQSFGFHPGGGELQLLAQVHHDLVFAQEALGQEQAAEFVNGEPQLDDFADTKAETAVVLLSQVEIFHLREWQLQGLEPQWFVAQ